MGITKSFGTYAAPRIGRLAPDLTTKAVLEALHHAIEGVGPLPPAARAAEKQLTEQHGNVERAVHEVIENNVRLAGAQGFVTNIGGLVTAPITLPANVTGLALIQCRMIAGIAHLRGHDLSDPKVRNAILACLLGEELVNPLIKRKKLPGTPMALATAPAYDAQLSTMLAGEVATFLISKVTGRRLVMVATKRVPVVGGIVGAGADGYSTWRAGRYADRELLPRARR